MSKIVYAWEWGAGTGHLRLFAPIAKHLVECGHEVTVVSRDLAGTLALFPHPTIRCLPAPSLKQARQARIQQPATIAQLAWNLGFDDEKQVADAIRSWFDLFQVLQPDLVISDFGLNSLAVTSAMGVPNARIGNGYLCPPKSDVPPLFDGFCGQLLDKAFEANTDKASHHVLSTINAALAGIGITARCSWEDLLPSSSRTILITIPLLDPYRTQRESDVSYLGFWDRCGGNSVVWPSEGSIRAFAYLKPFAGLPSLLESLAEMDVQVALVVDGKVNLQLSGTASSRIQQQSGMIDMTKVLDQCQFAICNGNHGTVCRMLTSGIPVLSAPLFLEHRLTAAAVQQHGCGIAIHPNVPETYAIAIEQMQSDLALNKAAEQFAAENQQYADGAFDRAIRQLDNLIAEVSG